MKNIIIKTNIVTINTDAGFYHEEKIGSFAYWIKGKELFLRGSGLFKTSCINSTDAEMKAILNALHVLDISGYTNIEKIIFNRDNIHAKSSQRGNELQRKISSKISELRKKCKYKSRYPFFEFRHVKAHSSTEKARNWVNDWCDKECTRQLRAWRSEQLKNQGFLYDLDIEAAIQMERTQMIDLVQSLKDYTHESHTILGHDEREASEFVDIYYTQAYCNQCTPQSNQCDGCNAGYPVENGIHKVPYPSGSMVCQKHIYND